LPEQENLRHNHPHAQEHNGLLNQLSEAGYRMTPQRAMIVAAIENSTNHISAEEIFASVITKYKHVNISTVYRTLELLKEKGLVTETDLGNGRVSYHPTGKGQHHHLVCHKCGAIIDLDETAFIDLKEMLRHKYGFIADLKHLAIFGRCLNCNT
jgi:Fur family transcriptional regulator, ferric uptake regulator